MTVSINKKAFQKYINPKLTIILLLVFIMFLSAFLLRIGVKK
jgi:hypothetical protein